MAALAAVEQSGFFGDDPPLVSVQTTEVERAPAEGLAGFDDLVKAFPFAFSLHDGFFGAQVRAHNFNQRKAASAYLWRQPLAHHPAQSVPQAVANLFLFLRLKQTADAVDGLAG